MIDLQRAKAHVRAFHDARDADPARAFAEFCDPALVWRGCHPWNEIAGAGAVARNVWEPLHAGLGPWQRRPDIFMAGTNHIDGDATVWVVEMGHFLGHWATPVLGLEPTGRLAFLRYCEFHRVEEGEGGAPRIVETASYLEVLGLIRQAGLYRLPQTGAALMTPGPRTHDGLLHDAQDAGAGRETLRIILDMVRELVAEDVSTTRPHLERHWTPDMMWFGPAGIGASTTFDGYFAGHTGPFERGLTFLHSDGHPVEMAEGSYGGFFGYPSITMRNTGGYMGIPANDRPAEMRLVDLYRVEGGKIAENWIFIDLLHFCMMQGVDLLSDAVAAQG